MAVFIESPSLRDLAGRSQHVYTCAQASIVRALKCCSLRPGNTEYMKKRRNSSLN